MPYGMEYVKECNECSKSLIEKFRRAEENMKEARLDLEREKAAKNEDTTISMED